MIFRFKSLRIVGLTLLFAIFCVSTFAGVDPADDLLPIGAEAPDFTLQQKGGGEVRLSTMLKANKVVLLNFWTIGCSPCLVELPKLNKLQKRLHRKGFDILSVNTLDPVLDATKYWDHQHLTLRMALEGDRTALEKYRVSAMPVNYLIGHNGKVLARYVGYEPANVLHVLAKSGIK